MVDTSWFDDLPEDFEESVRIDRDEQDHRQRAIRSYHMTADSRRFIEDFVDRMLGQSDDMRTGSNYWLYGYYGSGKSHLLTVLDGLLDTDWLDGQQDAVWSDLVQISGDSEFEQLGDHWRTIHDEYYVIPISVNLLKYQGQKQRSFSEIVLRHAHQDADLTGVDDGISEGLSSQLDVAYFEKWFRTTDAWSDRQARAEAALDGVTTGSQRLRVAIRRPLERHPEIWCVGRCRASQALRGGQRDSRWVYRSAAVRHRPRGSSG